MIFKWNIYYDNDKKWVKMLKVYGMNVFFPLIPTLTMYALYTHLNIDNYRWPLTMVSLVSRFFNTSILKYFQDNE